MEEKIYPHLRAVDKDDVIAILRNYESEVRRSDNKNRMVMADTISHCIVDIIGMDMWNPFRWTLSRRRSERS